MITKALHEPLYDRTAENDPKRRVFRDHEPESGKLALGRKTLGHARRFGAEIVNYADDFEICGRAPAAEMRSVVERMMERLRLPVNARKTRCLRVPGEPMEFLGYLVGRNYDPRTGVCAVSAARSVR